MLRDDSASSHNSSFSSLSDLKRSSTQSSQSSLHSSLGSIGCSGDGLRVTLVEEWKDTHSELCEDEDELTKVPIGRSRGPSEFSNDSNQSDLEEVTLPRPLRIATTIAGQTGFQPSPHAPEFKPSFTCHTRTESASSTVSTLPTPGLIDLDSPESATSQLAIVTPADVDPWRLVNDGKYDTFFQHDDELSWSALGVAPVEVQADPYGHAVPGPWSPSALRVEQRPASSATASTVTPTPASHGFAQQQRLHGHLPPNTLPALNEATHESQQWGNIQAWQRGQSTHNLPTLGANSFSHARHGSSGSNASSIRVFDLGTQTKPLTTQEAAHARQNAVHAAPSGHARRSSGSITTTASLEKQPSAHETHRFHILQAQERTLLPGAGLPGAGVPPKSARQIPATLDPISSLYALTQMSLDPAITEAVIKLAAQSRLNEGQQAQQAGPSPLNRKSALYKTELCRSFEEKGSCRCKYFENLIERLLIPSQTFIDANLHMVKKSCATSAATLGTGQKVSFICRYTENTLICQACRTYLTEGHCDYGMRCTFEHPADAATSVVQQQYQPQVPIMTSQGWPSAREQVPHSSSFRSAPAGYLSSPLTGDQEFSQRSRNSSYDSLYQSQEGLRLNLGRLPPSRRPSTGLSSASHEPWTPFSPQYYNNDSQSSSASSIAHSSPFSPTAAYSPLSNSTLPEPSAGVSSAISAIWSALPNSSIASLPQNVALHGAIGDKRQRPSQ